MKVWEFVVTGGPCAGKTKGLSILDQMLTEKGFKVIIVPETATEVILSGIHPVEIGINNFQEVIVQRSINKERTTREVAKFFQKDVVIIYDRGLLDCKAYVSDEVFQSVLQRQGITEADVRDVYHSVFHLVTAADGAEAYYTLENNAARSETPEQAIALDMKTRNAWVGHPRLRVIDNSADFKGKIDRLLAEVFSIVGLPEPSRVQRKYLIKKPRAEFFKTFKEAVKLQLVQVYLYSDDPFVEKRIRQRGDGISFSYYYTEKRNISTLVRQERERKITAEEYLALMSEGDRTVRKTRYCFLYKNQYFVLDVYPHWTRKAILEIELLNEEQIPELPNWAIVIEEVTGNPKYLNRNIAI